MHSECTQSLIEAVTKYNSYHQYVGLWLDRRLLDTTDVSGWTDGGFVKFNQVTKLLTKTILYFFLFIFSDSQQDIYIYLYFITELNDLQ